MAEELNEIPKVRRFLKERLLRDYTTFRGHQKERTNVHDVLQRTADLGESNSLLLIGPRGAGKTTLVNSVLAELLLTKDFVLNAMLVRLDGNLHTDDRLALKSITAQMQLENAVSGTVFGSFAENLAFLLACLKSGSKQSKSIIFILEEFDLFCAHHNQTLLYNLFDVSQSAQAPICVLGVTCRLDVIELLEKRVKSRFSHRQVFLFHNDRQDFEKHMELFQELLYLPSNKQLKEMGERIDRLRATKQSNCALLLPFQCNHFNPAKYKFGKKFTESWNKRIKALSLEKPIRAALQALYDLDVGEAALKTILFRMIATLSGSDVQKQLCAAVMTPLLNAIIETDDRVELLLGLSVLELCLAIAIKHHSEIYDRDPFNFEIIYARFSKFVKVSASMQGIERSVVLKAFEHLRNMEFIMPVATTGAGSKVQKDYELHKLALTVGQINRAVQRYQALPTEVSQWAQSSLI